MLSEEALILIVLAGALGLLALGVMELLWPSTPRRPSRVSPAPPSPVTRAPAAPVRRRRSKISPHARPHAGSSSTPWSPERPRVAAEPAVRNVAAPAPMGPPPARPVASPALDPGLVDRCFSLYQDGCHEDVIALGESALGRMRAEALGESGAHDAAALWSVTALARQALGDADGARAAFERALAVCPPEEQPTYRQHLAGLALEAARGSLVRAGSPETEERVEALRAARVWVARGLDVVPDDAQLRDVGEAVGAALWPAYTQTAHRHLQRQEFEEARRLLREALAEPDLPAARGEELQGLLSGTFSGEIGQLTALAIRSVQEEREGDALASLERAEELLAAIPAEALTPERRDEVDQRLWWGYTRLGVRRVESGQCEAAVAPLMRALRFPEIDRDRQRETRTALVRALDGVTEARALSIRQLAEGGQQEEAVLRTRALRELLRGCLEAGVAEDELALALERTQRLSDELGV